MDELGKLLLEIDEVVEAWEERPESWNPGDPLYERPPECGEACWDLLDQCTEECNFALSCEHECGHQVVAPMIEAILDYAPKEFPPFFCLSCNCAQLPAGLCWNCGQVVLPTTMVVGLFEPHAVEAADEVVVDEIMWAAIPMPRADKGAWKGAIFESLEPRGVSPQSPWSSHIPSG